MGHQVTVFPPQADSYNQAVEKLTDVNELLTDVNELLNADIGYIAVAGRTRVGNYILCHEEGLLRKLPQNNHFPHLVGTVVIAPPALVE
jgi:hypothetical protein